MSRSEEAFVVRDRNIDYDSWVGYLLRTIDLIHRRPLLLSSEHDGVWPDVMSTEFVVDGKATLGYDLTQGLP
jgi:hypothetical protein